MGVSSDTCHNLLREELNHRVSDPHRVAVQFCQAKGRLITTAGQLFDGRKSGYCCCTDYILQMIYYDIHYVLAIYMHYALGTNIYLLYKKIHFHICYAKINHEH